jgi:antitoxin ParD1/3/4
MRVKVVFCVALKRRIETDGQGRVRKGDCGLTAALGRLVQPAGTGVAADRIKRDSPACRGGALMAVYGKACHPKEIAMATMNVSLPDLLKAAVDEQVASGRYASASDYVRDLIRRDAESRAKWAEFHRLIQEGLDSPVVDQSLPEIIDEVRGEARMRTFDEVFDRALARARADGARD